MSEGEVTNGNLTTLWQGTDQMYAFHEWYVNYHGYVSIFVCVVGGVCNIFNILVLTRRNMVSTTNYILTALAVSDLLTMLSYIPFALQFYVLHGPEPNPERNTKSWIYFFLFHVNFTVTTHTTSIWLGVLLAGFRYGYLKLSSERSTKCGVERARIGVLFVYIASVIILIPNYLSITVQKGVHQPTNRTMWDIISIESSTSYGHLVTTINFWIHALVIKIIPCALMSVFGFLLICTMQTGHRKGRRLRNPSIRVPDAVRTRKRDHSRTTGMLVIVIVLFLITELPQGVLALCSGLLPRFFEAFYVPLGDAMDIVALVNNGVNFTLYCSMSRQFHETFLRLFLPCMLPPEKRQILNGMNQGSAFHNTAPATLNRLSPKRILFDSGMDSRFLFPDRRERDDWYRLIKHSRYGGALADMHL